MQASRAICETCGHTRDWHDRAAVRARLLTEPPDERPCYREIGGAPCRCGGFRESGAFVVSPASGIPRGTAPGLEIARVAAVVLLLLFLGLGLLYAYRSQTPAVPQVDMTQAVQNINAGCVRAVTIAANKATLEFRDTPAHKEQTTIPARDTVFLPAISSYNAVNPSQGIEIRHVSQSGETVGVIVSIILSLLPVLLIGGFFYYTMGSRRRS